MYGLPKVQTMNAPIWPMFSMEGSANHELAKWLIEVIGHALQYYFDYCIPDSFQFMSDMHKLQCTVGTEFLVFIGICSL